MIFFSNKSLVLATSENSFAISKNHSISAIVKTFDLILGFVGAVIAFPVFAIAIIFSFFFSQDQWEKFWDKFLEI